MKMTPFQPAPSSDTALVDVLLQVMRNLRKHYDAKAKVMGLTMARARVITVLGRNEGISQAELAGLLEIEAPTLKRQLDGLEADGFLERRDADGDARKKIVFLTHKGRESEINAFSRKLRSDVLDGIPPEDRERATAVLQQMCENLTRLGAL